MDDSNYPASCNLPSSKSIHAYCFRPCRCVLVLGFATFLLGRAYISLRHRNIDTSISTFWGLGFGGLTPYTYIVLGLPHTDPAGLISNVLIANLPQFILSILYIFYNSTLSCFLVQREFSRLYNIRKPLRVSEPEGIQRSSYFISLPLRYGIPLYVTSGILHWLISQSLFLARITAYLPDGTVDQNSTFSTCGYSPIAIIISKPSIPSHDLQTIVLITCSNSCRHFSCIIPHYYGFPKIRQYHASRVH